MTSFRVLIACALLAAAVPVAAQTDIHPGKVIVQSTASDAMTIAGGVNAAAGTISTVDAATGTVPIIFTIGRTGAATSAISRGVAMAFADANNPTYTAALVGLRTNSTADYNGDLGFFLATGGAVTPATSITSGMTRRVTFTSGGKILGTGGSVAAPSLATNSNPDTGVNITGAQVQIVTGGVSAMDFASFQAQMAGRDNGTGTGRSLTIGRNTNGTTPAAGSITFIESDGGASSVWVDASGVLRINGTPPSSAGGVGDTAGTVVGAQTSARAAKDVAGEVTNTAAALDIIRHTPIYQFTYKNGAYNGETFYGIVTDESPLFGMDHGRAFNPVTAFGATVLALRELDARLAALERENAALRAELMKGRR